MIHAYLSQGNADFQENALTEFILMNYKEGRLQKFKQEVEDIQSEYRTETMPNGLSSEEGRRKLELLMGGLLQSEKENE